MSSNMPRCRKSGADRRPLVSAEQPVDATQRRRIDVPDVPRHVIDLLDLAVMRRMEAVIHTRLQPERYVATAAITLGKLRVAEQLRPDHGPQRVLLGRALTRLGRLDQAEEVLEEAVERWPEDPRAFFALGVLRLRQDRLNEALEDIEAIVQVTDAIMVARGDLGVETPIADMPVVQKHIISLCNRYHKPVIVATQMLDSMQRSRIPTRAEVTDIATAILDGADACMLSGETAVGKHPAKVIQSMARICVEAEKQSTAMQSSHRLHTQFGRVDEAIAMASMYTANHLGVAAIASLTESGSTALWMSRISSGIPIYAMTEHVATRRRVTLYRGVYPISFQPTESDSQRINQEVVEELLRRGAVRDGDLVIITKGDFQGIPGGTNVMKILRVGEHILPD